MHFPGCLPRRRARSPGPSLLPGPPPASCTGTGLPMVSSLAGGLPPSCGFPSRVCCSERGCTPHLVPGEGRVWLPRPPSPPSPRGCVRGGPVPRGSHGQGRGRPVCAGAAALCSAPAWGPGLLPRFEDEGEGQGFPSECGPPECPAQPHPLPLPHHPGCLGSEPPLPDLQGEGPPQPVAGLECPPLQLPVRASPFPFPEGPCLCRPSSPAPLVASGRRGGGLC